MSSGPPAVSGSYYYETRSGKLYYIGTVPNNAVTRCVEGGVKGYFGAR
jgi:hypothetical protein